MTKSHALWSGRFEEGVDDFTQRFGASLPVDKRMYHEDIAGSIAHAQMLAAQNIISDEDMRLIVDGLRQIEKDIDSGDFVFDINDEDIHMAIEAELTRRIGEAGGRLHTGRSRNDQVATDTRLYTKRRLNELMACNVALREVLLEKAKDNLDAIMPGYTHMQHAQPILFSHQMLAYVWMLDRDYARLKYARKSTDRSPLGAAALAGTTYAIDRQATADALGFEAPIANSLDAVSDRDFLLDTIYACSVSALHLSRLCEEIILWSTSEFGFIALSDSYSTGSSIMPQKKNPDFAELIRSKSGRITGDLVALMMTLKSLPLAYNKDLQEDKEGVFDAMDSLEDCYTCAGGMIKTMRVNADAMRAAAATGFIAATDVADYLAKRGMPFREAHEITGELVLLCEKRGCDLTDLTMDDFKKASQLFDEDIHDCLDIAAIVDARMSYGGTARKQVEVQIEEASSRIQQDKAPF